MSGAVHAVGNAVSSVANTVGSAAGSVAAAPVNLLTEPVKSLAGALPSLGQSAGGLVSGVLGPDGQNTAALGSLAGAALGNPLALGGLSNPVSKSSGTQSVPYQYAPASGSAAPAASGGNTMMIVIIAAVGLGLILLLKRKK